MNKKKVLLDVVLKCIEDEEEFPGEMPEELWNDKSKVEEAFRSVVRVVKRNIKNRILNEVK